MGVWKKDGLTPIGNEEALTGRSLLMAKNLRKFIVESFSSEEIKNLSVIDVGAHDGWLLNQISELGFQKMFALEPRIENIARGKLIREHFDINDKVEFLHGDLESVKDQKFDIVICTGVLYHVTSIPDFLQQLSSITLRAIYLESRVIKLKVSRKIKNQITLDNTSSNFLNDVHLHAIKGETNYGGGSTYYNTIVSIPTVDSVRYILKYNGFKNIETKVSPKEFKQNIRKRNYPANFAIISGLKSEAQKFSQAKAIISYEKIYLDYSLPDTLVKFLDKTFLQKHLGTRVLYISLNSKNWKIITKILKTFFGLNSMQTKILFDLHYDIGSKLEFEKGKNLLRIDPLSSKTFFETLLERPNLDWRVTYRSLYFLLILTRMSGDSESKIIEDIVQCNPNFPIQELINARLS